MIIETCTTDAGPQFMASPLSRPSRRPKVAQQQTDSDLNVYPRDGAHQLVSDSKPKKTLKRPRRLSDGEKHDRFGLKKQRFAIEVDARPRAQPRKSPGAAAAAVKTAKIPAKSTGALAQRTAGDKEEGSRDATRQLPKYAEKASNGIKHELERLQPDRKDTKSETRKLRSQEGTRFKSELASYFPDYDVVIGNEAAEETRKFACCWITCCCSRSVSNFLQILLMLGRPL